MVLDLKIAFRLVVPYMVLHGIAGRDRTRHGKARPTRRMGNILQKIRNRI